MSSGFRIVLRAAAAFFAFAGLTCQASASTPIWWGNSIGRADVVLPGWSPVEVDGSTLVLGADRRYEWKASLLPARVSVGDDLLAGPFRLVATINGERVDIAGDRLVITQESPSSATVDTEGSLADDLSVVVSTRVEYDGLGSISITLTPGAPVNLDGFDLEVDIVRSEYQRMLAFDADTIHKRHKQVVFPAEYAGPFLNVLGFPDGERSFWLFADHAEGWIWNSNTVTEVAAHEDLLRIRQRLIGAAWTVSKPMHFEIHFLATPVRNASGEWRTHRAARLINEEEAKIAHYQTWWMTAFAHQDLPYTDYPDGVRARLPKADIDAYPGVVANRAHLDGCRAVGITRLPYFSAHTLSGLDPVLEIYRDRWEVVPLKVMPDASDAPFTAEIGKRWLSQRGEGYTDYLLHRFAAMIGELGFDGLYFDQGGVIGSKNPASGGWTDSNGVRQAGTDILATRAFFKRLAVLFHERGKPGLVVVHNSRVGVVPAYTFVTSMLQGEEYTVELAAGDYIRSTDLDELRSVFAPGQYGVGVTWMSQLFSPRTNIPARRGRDKETWLNSTDYETAFRNFMALALLHDTSVWAHAPVDQRAVVYAWFDAFGVADARFSGYWTGAVHATADDVYVSAYSTEDGRAMLVVANLGDADLRNVEVEGVNRLIGSASFRARKKRSAPMRRVGRSGLRVDVPSKNFLLIEVEALGRTGEESGA